MPLSRESARNDAVIDVTAMQHRSRCIDIQSAMEGRHAT